MSDGRYPAWKLERSFSYHLAPEGNFYVIFFLHLYLSLELMVLHYLAETLFTFVFESGFFVFEGFFFVLSSP